MKIGELWQKVIGSYKSFIDLGNNHESGLDIISYEKKIIIELKNRTNTDNSSSRKTNFDKLVRFKRKYSDYMCIYGNINDSKKINTLNGYRKIIIHDGIEIYQYVGMKLLELVFEDETELIVNFMRNILSYYDL